MESSTDDPIDLENIHLENDEVRAPDQAYNDTLVNDDDLDQRIAELISQDIEPDVALMIVQEQMMAEKHRKQMLFHEHKAAMLKRKNEFEEMQKHKQIEAWKENSEKKKEEENEKKNKELFGVLRFFKKDEQELINKALKSGEAYEITDKKFKELEKEINKIVTANRMTKHQKKIIMDLFTTPIGNEDEDEYAYDDYDGGRKTRRRRNTKKSRKSKKSKKSRKYK
jgi:hypothetical protein